MLSIVEQELLSRAEREKWDQYFSGLKSKVEKQRQSIKVRDESVAEHQMRIYQVRESRNDIVSR